MVIETFLLAYILALFARSPVFTMSIKKLLQLLSFYLSELPSLRNKSKMDCKLLLLNLFLPSLHLTNAVWSKSKPLTFSGPSPELYCFSQYNVSGRAKISLDESRARDLSVGISRYKKAAVNHYRVMLNYQL